MSDQFRFEINFAPVGPSQTLKALSLAVHSSSQNSATEEQVIKVVVKCEHSTLLHHINSYVISEANEWSEFYINITYIPCSESEDWKFLIQVMEPPILLDDLHPILIVYTYSKFGGFENRLASSLQKRYSEGTFNRTTLSELRESGSSCSVHTTYFYFTELPILGADEEIISPDPHGINLTFCYGTCSEPLPNNPSTNFVNVTRAQLLYHISQDENSLMPSSSCIPDKIENEMLLRYSHEDDLTQLRTFPRVTSCKCLL